MNKIIVVHIDSGLGNQMLSYCEYLAMQKANPNAQLYVETIMFDIPEAEDYVSQWNGYELESIFGIKAKNLSSYFSPEQWSRIMDSICKSEFWKNDWNYPKFFLDAFKAEGLVLTNTSKDFVAEKVKQRESFLYRTYLRVRTALFNNSWIGNAIKHQRYMCLYRQGKSARPKNTKLFMKAEENIFVRQKFAFRYNGHNIEAIEKEIHESFKFPEFRNPKNIEMIEMMNVCNAVAIHARRGDMLGANGYCYKYGYFKRAVSHIRKHVENPVFVFFTNPGSIDWCKENAKIFGLDFSKDKVCFVDWNRGKESFRDMQLMSYCKHAIITNSTFGWWGAYFIKNPNKITISPVEEVDINTTYHC